MADSQPFSVTKLLAGLGGALLIASFFLPLVNTSTPGASDAFGVRDLRRHIDATREADAVRPLIDPALQALDKFAATPSLYNLTAVTGATRQLLDKAADIGVPDADKMRMASGMLGWVRLGLWLLPLVGLVQLAVPAVTRLRGHAGFAGLVARFFFGMLFVLIALVPIIGASNSQESMIGTAIWVLLVGAASMMIAGLFGVTRRNWWAVLLVDAALVAATVFAIKAFAEAMQKL